MSTKNYSILTKKYKQILSASHMLYRLVNSTYNVSELALRLTRLVCQFVTASSSEVYILDPKKKKIVFIAVFKNNINIMINKKKDLAAVSDEELNVAKGYSINKKHILAIPLVADEILGAIFVRRKKNEPAFDEFDKEILSVFVEQSVTAIKNLQLYEEQQKIVLGSIKFIGKLLEQQKEATYNSAPRLFKIIKSLGEKLKISQEEINNLYYAAMMRDAGAMDVPYNVLSKRSQLTSDEFKIIRNQPKRIAELIQPVEFLKPVLPIILYHHEKYDGTGYPFGLKKDQIPLSASIMAVVEAFDAMTRERLYKTRLSIDEAVNEIKRNSGTQFDPKVVNAFISVVNQKKIKKFL